MPAFQPYWGKPAVRNDRGDRGNVGIIRSPLRASIPPDCGGREVDSRPYRDRREFIALLAGGTMWPLGAEGIRDAACRFSASPSNFAGALWSVKFSILLAFQTGDAGREIPANPTSQSMRHQPHKEETNCSPERQWTIL